MISIENLCFSYNVKAPLISNISFTANKGDIVAIIGANGSGKTTFLDIILGFQKPEAGHVEIKSDVKRLLIPANVNNFILPWYSGLRNINFYISRGELKKLTIMQYRKIISLSQYFFERNFKEILKRKSFLYSSGEKALLSLICAILVKPELLVLDEVFANLSERAINKLILYFQENRNEYVILFTSHNNVVVDSFANKRIIIDEKN